MEGNTIHHSPESCVATREGRGEALTGECIGQPSSRESFQVPSADALRRAEGNTHGSALASSWAAWRGRRPWHVRKLFTREPGDLGSGLWTQRWRKRQATGDMVVTRFADDVVLGFEHRADAERYEQDVRDRLAEFALEFHPDKTQLIEFGRHAAARRKQQGQTKPETFTFLGFTLICGRSRKGGFLILRKTRGDRMRATLAHVKEQLRKRMHQSIPEQGRWLQQVVRGYFAYHAVQTNTRAMQAFRHHIQTLWRRSLSRGSQKGLVLWARFTQLANDWLPKATILHPWPNQRFDVKYPRWEPSARIAPARICAGGRG
jgi:RNA-directed DNA polymerase